VRLWIPAGSLHEQPVDICPVFSPLGCVAAIGLAVIQVSESELDRIDGVTVLARIVLQRSSQEGLGKEERGNPERGRSAIVAPALNKGSLCSRSATQGVSGLSEG